MTYKGKNDFINYYDNLIVLLNLYKNLDDKIQHEFNFTDFLKELLNELKDENENENLVKIFELINLSIDTTTSYEYIYDVPNILLLLLEELSLKDIDNSRVLANKICRTKGLIQYSNLFSKFI